MKMKKAYIFDLDGTIVDSLGSIATCANGRLEELGLKTHSLESYKQFVGEGQYELIRRALRASGDEKLEHYDVAMARYIEVFKDTCHIGCVPYEGIVDMLQKLKEQNVKLAVLSNKAHMNTMQVVAHVFGENLFDEVQGQMEGVARKPDPEGVFQIMKKLDVIPEECVYVGDTSTDMKTGKAAGIFTVGVTWGFRDKKELEEHGADAIVEKAEELLEFV